MRLFNERLNDPIKISCGNLIIIDSNLKLVEPKYHIFPDIYNYSYSATVKKGKYYVHLDIDETNKYFPIVKVGVLHESFADIVEINASDNKYINNNASNKTSETSMFITPRLASNGLFRFLGIKVDSCKLFIGDTKYYKENHFQLMNDINDFYSIRTNYDKVYSNNNGITILTDSCTFNMELILRPNDKEEIIGAIVYLNKEYKG